MCQFSNQSTKKPKKSSFRFQFLDFKHTASRFSPKLVRLSALVVGMFLFSPNFHFFSLIFSQQRLLFSSQSFSPIFYSDESIYFLEAIRLSLVRSFFSARTFSLGSIFYVGCSWEMFAESFSKGVFRNSFSYPIRKVMRGYIQIDGILQHDITRFFILNRNSRHLNARKPLKIFHVNRRSQQRVIIPNIFGGWCFPLYLFICPLYLLPRIPTNIISSFVSIAAYLPGKKKFI